MGPTRLSLLCGATSALMPPPQRRGEGGAGGIDGKLPVRGFAERTGGVVWVEGKWVDERNAAAVVGLAVCLLGTAVHGGLKGTQAGTDTRGWPACSSAAARQPASQPAPATAAPINLALATPLRALQTCGGGCIQMSLINSACGMRRGAAAPSTTWVPWLAGTCCRRGLLSARRKAWLLHCSLHGAWHRALAVGRCWLCAAAVG